MSIVLDFSSFDKLDFLETVNHSQIKDYFVQHTKGRKMLLAYDAE